MTALPPSEGKDTILTVVDSFSKAVHIVTLPNLSSAAETAKLMVVHFPDSWDTLGHCL